MSYAVVIIAAIIGIAGAALRTEPDTPFNIRRPLAHITTGGRLVILLLLGSIAAGAASQNMEDREKSQVRMNDSIRFDSTIDQLRAQRVRDSTLLALNSAMLSFDSVNFQETLSNLELQLAKQDSLLDRTAVQLGQQSESLRMLRRTITRFDRLAFQVEFRYPLTNPRYNSYIEDVRRRAAEALNAYVRGNDYAPIRTDGTVAYVNYDTIWGVSGRWDVAGDSAIVEHVDVGPEAPVALRSDPRKGRDLGNLLGQASLHLAFYRRDRELARPDLKLSVLAWNPVTRQHPVGTHSLDGADPAAIRLQINFRSGEVRQTLYTSSYERSDGGLANEIISIEDLVGSTLIIAREEPRINNILIGEAARLESFQILWGADLANRIILDRCRLDWQSTPSGFRRVVYHFTGTEAGLHSSSIHRARSDTERCPTT